LAIEPFR